MTARAIPKAPGAAAVYLNVEEIANDPLHFESFYARIKSARRKGLKELATVDVPLLAGQLQDHGYQGPHHPCRMELRDSA